MGQLLTSAIPCIIIALMSSREEVRKIKLLHPELGYRSIGKLTGLNHNTVRYHLDDNYRPTHNARQRRNRKSIRKEYKLKAGGKCSKCGYDKYLEVLDFHHRDPRNKIYSIGALFSDRGRKTIEKEISKCVLLCANCHREEHILQRTEESKTGETELGTRSEQVGLLPVRPLMNNDSAIDKRTRRKRLYNTEGKCDRCSPHSGENHRRRPRPDRYKTGMRKKDKSASLGE